MEMIDHPGLSILVCQPLFHLSREDSQFFRVVSDNKFVSVGVTRIKGKVSLI